MSERDDSFYREYIAGNSDTDFSEGDILKLIKLLKEMDNGDSESDLDNEYEIADVDDFLERNNAIEKFLASLDEEEDDDDDSTGGDAKDEDSQIPSDEGEKEVKADVSMTEGEKEGKKGGGCVSDKGVKKARRRVSPSEEDLTRMNVASVLADLRF